MSDHDWKRESPYDIDPDSDWFRCTKCKRLTRSPWDHPFDCPSHMTQPLTTGSDDEPR